MAKTREIKKRIKAVANIKRITRTMQMIATAKFSAAQQRSLAGKPYTEALFDLVAELASGAGDSLDHPLLKSQEKPGARTLTLVLTSDRGLCGPYNGSILRTSMAYFRADEAARSGVIEVVGKKGVGFYKFNKINVTTHHVQFGDKPQYDEVDRLAQSYIDRFIAGEVGRVNVVYMRYISAGKQAPEVMQLLPFKTPARASAAEGAAGVNAIYEFSPAGPELLAVIVPAAIKATLFQAFKDAVVSEHVARMVAMKAATDNAGKMGKALTRTYNRARQAQITTELTEIISGAAALE
ncbi:MAG TPA: ATP synthase F1 subunit gamma [Phycisphaerales bacterium]|nr:ATP synthase F1 subunit gamma [Phycisphaerales bacterium]